MDDVYVKTDIDFITAILGGEITVPTLYGNAKICMPEGIQPGDIKRLANRGIKNADTGHCGHQYVILNVKIPRYKETI
jgi:DnaJ-class molecular chaperone